MLPVFFYLQFIKNPVLLFWEYAFSHSINSIQKKMRKNLKLNLKCDFESAIFVYVCAKAVNHGYFAQLIIFFGWQCTMCDLVTIK